MLLEVGREHLPRVIIGRSVRVVVVVVVVWGMGMAAAAGLRRRVDEPLQVRVDGLAVRPEELEQVGEQRREVAREECVRVARLALPPRPADAVHVLRQGGAKVPADHVTQPWGGSKGGGSATWGSRPERRRSHAPVM